LICSKFYINNFESLKENLLKRGVNSLELIKLKTHLESRNTELKILEKLRCEANKIREILHLSGIKGANSKNKLKRLSDLKCSIKNKEHNYRLLEKESRIMLLSIPNLLHAESYIGDFNSDENNTVILENIKNKTNDTKPHWAIAEKLNIFDEKRSTKISGTGFSILIRDGAKLLRALTNFALDTHTANYHEINLPELVIEDTMIGSGHLPKFTSQAYSIEESNLWAIPTAEVPMAALHKREVLEPIMLPLKYVSYSHCFRKEVGNRGNLSRGMQRLHEYHQVELFAYCKPQHEDLIYNKLLQDALKCLIKLEIDYRVSKIRAKDLPFAARRALKIEVFSPGTKRWLSVSTVCDFGDFQSRRNDIKFRENNKNKYLVTMNASALAVSRIWGVLLEYGAQINGNVILPMVLREYMGGTHILKHQK
jgi:seryl-tRNA synthetase